MGANTEFEDLNEFLSPELTLPVGGHAYSVAPSADLVLRLRKFYTQPQPNGVDQTAAEAEGLALSAEIYGATYDPDTQIITGAEGSVWAQMEADGVPGHQLLRIAQTAMIWYGFSRELAKTYWQTGMVFDPKAVAEEAKQLAEEGQPKPNRQTRRTAAKKAGSKAHTAGTTPAPAPSE